VAATTRDPGGADRPGDCLQENRRGVLVRPWSFPLLPFALPPSCLFYHLLLPMSPSPLSLFFFFTLFSPAYPLFFFLVFSSPSSPFPPSLFFLRFPVRLSPCRLLRSAATLCQSMSFFASLRPQKRLSSPAVSRMPNADLGRGEGALVASHPGLSLSSSE